jgi:hypothetical protein
VYVDSDAVRLYLAGKAYLIEDVVNDGRYALLESLTRAFFERLTHR